VLQLLGKLAADRIGNVELTMPIQPAPLALE
jgi:hypothetical protein